MKKLKPPSFMSDRIEGVRLTLDDVEHVLETLRHDDGELTISDKDFAYESIDELIEKRGTRPASFRLESKCVGEAYRSASVEFQASTVLLRTHEDPRFHELRDFLRTKACWRYKAASPWPWLLILLPSASLVASVLGDPGNAMQGLPSWFWSAFAILCGAPILCSFYRHRDFGVRLVRPHSGGFWRRNCDQVVLIVVAAVVGGVATKLIGALLE